MAKPTVASRLVAGLIALGYVEQPRTTHYRVFAKPNSVPRLYVGKAGALRFSGTGRVTQSRVVRENGRAKVLAAA